MSDEVVQAVLAELQAMVEHKTKRIREIRAEDEYSGRKSNGITMRAGERTGLMYAIHLLEQRRVEGAMRGDHTTTQTTPSPSIV